MEVKNGTTEIFTSKDDHRTLNVDADAHRLGITHNEMVQKYDQWAQEYEKDLKPRYKGPQYTADAVLKYIGKRKSARILDAAAGTGLVGELLKNNGYTNVDALDPSEQMLNIARDKNIYKNLIYDMLGGHKAPIPKNTYDALTICGGMGEGHIPPVAFKEIINIVKPGGIVIVTMRHQYLTTCSAYKDQLEPYFKELQANGLWEQQERTILPYYSWDNDGVQYVYKIL